MIFAMALVTLFENSHYITVFYLIMHRLKMLTISIIEIKD